MRDFENKYTFVIFKLPAPSTNILIVPLGPKLDLTTFAKPIEPAVLTAKAWALLTLSAWGLINSTPDLAVITI